MTFPEPFLNENDETLFIGLIVSGVLMVAVAGLVLYNLLKQKHSESEEEEQPNESYTEKKEDTKEKPDNKIQSKTHHVPTAHDGVDDDRYIGSKEEESQEKSTNNEDQPSANNSDKKEEAGENKDQPPGNKVESTDKGVGQDGNDKFLLIGYIIVGVIVVAVLYDIFILKYYFQLFWKVVQIL